MMKSLFVLTLLLSGSAFANNLQGGLFSQSKGNTKPAFDKSVVLEQKTSDGYKAVSWFYTNPQGGFYFSNIDSGTYRLNVSGKFFELPSVKNDGSDQNIGAFFIQE